MSDEGGTGWAAPTRTCARCGAESRGGAFCASCGSPLDPSTSATGAAWSAPGESATAPTYVPPPVAAGAYAPPGAPPYGVATGGTNGFAVASLVLGIVWLCGLGSILALIFGLVALSQIEQRRQSGRGMAIAGIVLGAIGVALLVIGIIASAVSDDTSDDDFRFAPPRAAVELPWDV